MANVTGPTSKLPGHITKSPEGIMCDDHPDVLAVARLTGETDSFGSEEHDLCQSCYNEHKKHINDLSPGICDWCKSSAKHLKPRRDYKEGSHGRVYYVCQSCIDKELENLRDDDRWHDCDDGYYDSF